MSDATRRGRVVALRRRFPPGPIRQSDHPCDPRWPGFQNYDVADIERARQLFRVGMFCHTPDGQNWCLTVVNPDNLSVRALKAFPVGNYIRGQDMPEHSLKMFDLIPGFRVS